MIDVVYIVFYDSRMLGTVFHGVYATDELAEAEVKRMTSDGIEYWADEWPMNKNTND